ncbi:MAG: NmrA family NAD(P)-binding protein [Rhodospirillaceae bacterium]|jgi:NAD(P)H dehydrogenase (quinone)|nr:NmrA family NAD(P)-binding protein [Rhodospirillaceae bacterium]
MILVTCAGGRTGKAIISALVEAGLPVRAMVRQSGSVAAIDGLGAAETIVGNLENSADVATAVDGVSAVYYIAPNMNPRERMIGDAIIAAAKQGGVSRFVFHSTLHTQLEALPHHWERHFVEQALINSGLPFTVLQCGSYMQNMLPAWSKMVETGVHRMAYDVDAPMSLVDLDDICAVALTVLTGEGYLGGIFELAGEAITMTEKAAILSRVVGTEIRAEKEPLADFLAHGKAVGFSDYTLQMMARMFPYYDVHGLVGSPKILGWLLGRAPTDFESFARRVVAASA